MAIDYYNAGMDAFEAGKYKEAFDLLIQDDQNHKCAFALGVMYYNAQGVECNEVKSTYYYTIAAEAGITPAQVNVGLAYINAVGVSQNFETAVRYLEPASQSGDISAKITIAEIYAMEKAGGTKQEAAKIIHEISDYTNSKEAMYVYNKYKLESI